MPIVLHDNALEKFPSIANKSDMRGDYKRQKCIQGDPNISYADATKNVEVTHDDSHWELFPGMNNSLMEGCTKENTKILSEFVDGDVITVEVETKEYIMSFSTFYDRIVMMFFTSKVPYLTWIKQWLHNVVHVDCVEDFMSPHFVLKSIAINYSISCLCSIGEVWSIQYLGGR